MPNNDNQNNVDNNGASMPQNNQSANDNPNAAQNGANKKVPDSSEKGKSKFGVFIEKIVHIIALPFQVILDLIHSAASWLKSKAFGEEYMKKEGYREAQDLRRFEDRQNAKKNIEHIEKVSEQYINQMKMLGAERSENDISKVKCKVSNLGADNKAVYQFTVTCENKSKYTVYADKDLKIDGNSICPDDVMVQLSEMLEKCHVNTENFNNPKNDVPQKDNDEEERNEEDIPEEAPEERQNDESKISKDEPHNELWLVKINIDKAKSVEGSVRKFAEKYVIGKDAKNSQILKYREEHEKYKYTKKPMSNDAIAKCVENKVKTAEHKKDDGVMLFINGDVSIYVERENPEDKNQPLYSITVYDNNWERGNNSVCINNCSIDKANDTEGIKDAVKYLIDLQTMNDAKERQKILEKISNKDGVNKNVEARLETVNNYMLRIDKKEADADISDIYNHNLSAISGLKDTNNSKAMANSIFKQINSSAKDQYFFTKDLVYESRVSQDGSANISIFKYDKETSELYPVAPMYCPKDIMSRGENSSLYKSFVRNFSREIENAVSGAERKQEVLDNIGKSGYDNKTRIDVSQNGRAIIVQDSIDVKEFYFNNNKLMDYLYKDESLKSEISDIIKEYNDFEKQNYPVFEGGESQKAVNNIMAGYNSSVLRLVSANSIYYEFKPSDASHVQLSIGKLTAEDNKAVLNKVFKKNIEITDGMFKSKEIDDVKTAGEIFEALKDDRIMSVLFPNELSNDSARQSQQVL